MSQTLPRPQIDGLDFTITGAVKVDTARVQMSRYAWFDRDFDGCLWICQPISWSWGGRDWSRSRAARSRRRGTGQCIAVPSMITSTTTRAATTPVRPRMKGQYWQEPSPDRCRR